MTDPTPSEEKNLFKWIEMAMLLVFVMAGVPTVVATALLLAAAVWEMVHAGLVVLHVLPTPPGASSAVAAGVQKAIKGLELYLLAPLGYFMLLSLAMYVKETRRPTPRHDIESKLSGVKALTMGLLVAVVAADLVGKVLSSSGVTFETAATECLILLVLGGIYWMLHQQALTAPHRSAASGDSGDK